MSMTAAQPFARRPAELAQARAGLPLVPVGVFLLCLVWRAPGLLTAPRFWAEEGTVYYAQLQTLSPLKGLVRVFNGNYQFLTNAIVELALLVPVRYAAHVTTYLGLGVALGCCWLIARLLLARGCSTWTASAACALFALQPGGYEVFLNATNVQWLSSVIAVALLLAEDMPAWGPRAILHYAVLLVCGLTGTTSCILLPLFLARAVWRPSTFGWTLLVLLGMATAIQGSIVLAYRADVHRAFALTGHVVLPEVFQVFFAQLMPAHLLDVVGTLVAPRDGLGVMTAIEVALLGYAGIGAMAFMASRSIGTFTAVMLLAGAVLIPLVNEFGSISGADAMLSGWAGARYFFVGASCMTILMAACLDAPTPPVRVCGVVLVALALLNGVANAEVATWTMQNLVGPSVAEQVDACRGQASCTIMAWPTVGSFPVEVHPSP